MTRLEKATWYARIYKKRHDHKVIMNLSHDAIVITEAELDEPGPHIIFVNPAFQKLSGYDRSELLGCSPRILQGARTDRIELARMRQALRDEQAFESEIVNYRKGGTAYRMGWAVVPLRSRADDICGWLSLQNDIGEEARDAARGIRRHQPQYIL